MAKTSQQEEPGRQYLPRENEQSRRAGVTNAKLLHVRTEQEHATKTSRQSDQIFAHKSHVSLEPCEGGLAGAAARRRSALAT